MKWVNHEIVTGSIMFAISNDLLSAALAMAGSVFPDWIEGRPTLFNYSSWRKNHRGVSHFFLLYFLAFLLLAFIKTISYSILLQYVIYFVFGAILHVLEDALCGKVPLLKLNKKTGLKLFTVGSVREYFISLIFFVCIFLECIKICVKYVVIMQNGCIDSHAVICV